MMTIQTLLWEFFFVYDYDGVSRLSKYLLEHNQHVWTNDYNLLYVLPWDMSRIFYAEYASYADREYMVLKNNWSRIIESTHAIFCGLFAFISILSKIKHNTNSYLLALGVSMGSQLMNSILYISNYLIEINSPYSINYDSASFPCGILLSKRPFMWINILWTVMPTYIIYKIFAKTTNSEVK
tara:strand:+ start:476 stop:1021 length:546 start_codon:yes stop_codon:yes gene_type:complete